MKWVIFVVLSVLLFCSLSVWFLHFQFLLRVDVFFLNAFSFWSFLLWFLTSCYSVLSNLWCALWATIRCVCKASSSQTMTHNSPPTHPSSQFTHSNSLFLEWECWDAVNINSIPFPPTYSHTSIKMNNHPFTIQYNLQAHTRTRRTSKDNSVGKLYLFLRHPHTHHSQRRQAKRVRER